MVNALVSNKVAIANNELFMLPKFICKLCDQSMSSRHSLKRHMDGIHSGNRNFICTWTGCGRSFAQKGNLKIHFRLHTGERPYSCNKCSKSFVSGSALSNHTKSHKSEGECNRKLGNQTPMPGHSLEDSGEKTPTIIAYSYSPYPSQKSPEISIEEFMGESIKSTFSSSQPEISEFCSPSSLSPSAAMNLSADAWCSASTFSDSSSENVTGSQTEFTPSSTKGSTGWDSEYQVFDQVNYAFASGSHTSILPYQTGSPEIGNMDFEELSYPPEP